jgi:hypothetical protein
VAAEVTWASGQQEGGGRAAIARIGAGALSVNVATQIPSGLAQVTNMGPGCGTPLPTIAATGGLPQIPNAGFGLQLTADANSLVFLLFSTQSANLDLGLGCTQYVDGATLIGAFPIQANASGQASFALPIPAALSPTDLAVQAFEIAANGPVLGFLVASNGYAPLFIVILNVKLINACPFAAR